MRTSSIKCREGGRAKRGSFSSKTMETDRRVGMGVQFPCHPHVMCVYIYIYIRISIYGGCPIFLYLKTTLSPCLSRAFRGLSRPKENPQKLHLTTITKAYMLTHIILPFRRPFRRAFADLSRPQKSTHFASHMFRLCIKCKQRF